MPALHAIALAAPLAGDLTLRLEPQTVWLRELCNNRL
jgi:hypothetical protein